MPTMKKLWLSLGAVLALALSGTAARADTIPWGYSATDTVIFNSNNPIMTSSIVFKGSSGVATNSSGIIIYNLSTTSSADSTSPDSFAGVPFSLGVTLTDIGATSSKSPGAISSLPVSFTGMFNASNVTKSSLLPGPVSWTSPTEAIVTLGSDDTGW